MLTKLFETLIQCIINFLSHAAGQAETGHISPNRRFFSKGLLGRLLGRQQGLPNSAVVPAPSADAPVVIGEIIPSAREALRQRNVPPVPISLTTQMRSKHLYCVGKSGMGKTNFNVQLIDADIAAGDGDSGSDARAVVLLDYRGDLADRVCKRLAARYDPEELADRLLLIDLRTPPAAAGIPQEAFTVPFNPLTQCGPNPYTRAFFVLDVFEQHLGAALGVQISETLRNCLLALAMTGRTLLDIELILSSDEARAEILSQVADTGVLRFFARYAALNEAQKMLWANPIQNKISPWIAHPVLKNMLGSSISVSIQDFLDQRPNAIILFCAGADEHFGSTAALMTNLFVNSVAAAAMRTNRPRRGGVLLYVDEFQNLSSDKFAEIISEGRRFGLWTTLSHQSPSQLEPKIRTLVRNVVGTSLFFGVGGVDAESLAGEIASDEPKTVLRNLLINQGVGEAMLVRQGMAAARIKTRHAPDPEVSDAAVHALRQACLRRHGRPASEVEQELRMREALFPHPAVGQKPKDQTARKTTAGAAAVRSPKRSKGHLGFPPDSEQYEVRDHDE